MTSTATSAATAMISVRPDDQQAVITGDENFPVRIKLLRQMLKLSQERFAEWLLDSHLIEVSRETVNLWEAGRVPSKSYKRVLYRSVEYNLNEIIGAHESR